ncbi:MAG: twin-arginine translocase subunit TatC [Candidatus Aenigmatarchaeota archaeon]
MSKNAKEMTFWEHTRELLVRLKRIFYSIIIATLISMLFPIDIFSINISATNPWYPTLTTFIINKVTKDFLPSNAKLIPIGLMDPLEIYIVSSLIIGISLSMPIIFYEAYKFINPALYEHERKFLHKLTISFTALFLFGVIFGYLFIMPITIRVLILGTKLLNLEPQYSFSSFFSVVIGGIFVCGLAFTLPIFIIILIEIGILKTEYFSKNRKYFYAALFIVLAILTPDPSPVSDIILFIPIFILMELTIIIGKRIEKSRSKT